MRREPKCCCVRWQRGNWQPLPCPPIPAASWCSVHLFILVGDTALEDHQDVKKLSKLRQDIVQAQGLRLRGCEAPQYLSETRYPAIDGYRALGSLLAASDMTAPIWMWVNFYREIRSRRNNGDGGFLHAHRGEMYSHVRLSESKSV